MSQKAFPNCLPHFPLGAYEKVGCGHTIKTTPARSKSLVAMIPLLSNLLLFVIRKQVICTKCPTLESNTTLMNGLGSINHSCWWTNRAGHQDPRCTSRGYRTPRSTAPCILQMPADYPTRKEISSRSSQNLIGHEE